MYHHYCKKIIIKLIININILIQIRCIIILIISCKLQFSQNHKLTNYLCLNNKKRNKLGNSITLTHQKVIAIIKFFGNIDEFYIYIL